MQINSALTLYAFSIKDKLCKDKEAISIFIYSKNKLIESRQQCRVHVDTIRTVVRMIVATESDLTSLSR